MATKYTARFQPQAWINDYAVNVDCEGPDTWDVTEYIQSLTESERRDVMRADDYPSDCLRDLSNAPQWVRGWTGPFYVEVTEEI